VGGDRRVLSTGAVRTGTSTSVGGGRVASQLLRPCRPQGLRRRLRPRKTPHKFFPGGGRRVRYRHWRRQRPSPPSERQHREIVRRAG
jgi:hypothetical protein